MDGFYTSKSPCIGVSVGATSVGRHDRLGQPTRLNAQETPVSSCQIARESIGVSSSAAVSMAADRSARRSNTSFRGSSVVSCSRIGIKKKGNRRPQAALTRLDGPNFLHSLAKQGGSCVLSKADDLGHVVVTIHAAFAGGRYRSPTVEAVLLSAPALAMPRHDR